MNTENAIRYNPNAQPAHLLVTIGEWQYKVFMSGESYLVVAGGVLFPVPCPLPIDTLLGAQFAAWLVRNRRWWPAVFISIVALVMLQIALMWADESGEFAASFIMRFSYIMNTVLVVLAGLCAIAAGIYQFKNGLTIKYDFEGKSQPDLLTAGDISINPDVLVMANSESEEPADFIQRIDAANIIQKPGQWVVIIAFRHPSVVVIMNPGKDEEAAQAVFHRSEPPYETSEWTTEERTARMVRFERETFGEYIDYIRRFSLHFPEWAKAQKLKQEEPVEALQNMIKNSKA